MSKIFLRTPGGILDMKAGYNLGLPGAAGIARAEVQELEPFLVLGGALRRWDVVGATPKEIRSEAVEHLRAIMLLYNEQASKGKVFLHEQPDGLTDTDVGLSTRER